MSALERESYSYVVDVIKGVSTITENDMLARKTHLKVFFPRLVEDQSPKEVIHQLYEKHVINDDDMDEIRREEANKGRKAATYTCMLLDRIPTRSPSWFFDFLQALRSSDQGFLADEIEDTNRKTTLTLSRSGSQENQESNTYQKYLTPVYKSSTDKQEDEVGRNKQFTETKDKLKHKLKKPVILKQIHKQELESAQREVETLLKVIRHYPDDAGNVDTVSSKEIYFPN